MKCKICDMGITIAPGAHGRVVVALYEATATRAGKLEPKGTFLGIAHKSCIEGVIKDVRKATS